MNQVSPILQKQQQQQKLAIQTHSEALFLLSSPSREKSCLKKGKTTHWVTGLPPDSFTIHPTKVPQRSRAANRVQLDCDIVSGDISYRRCMFSHIPCLETKEKLIMPLLRNRAYIAVQKSLNNLNGYNNISLY